MPQILNWSKTICLLHNIGYLHFQASVSRQMYNIHYTSFFSHVLNEKCYIFIILLWCIFFINGPIDNVSINAYLRHSASTSETQRTISTWLVCTKCWWSFSTIKKICFTSYLKLKLIKQYYLKNRLTSIRPITNACTKFITKFHHFNFHLGVCVWQTENINLWVSYFIWVNMRSTERSYIFIHWQYKGVLIEHWSAAMLSGW